MRIIAPHFVAGLVLNEDKICVRTAPILNYMLGWNWWQVIAYCKKKRWSYEHV